MPSRSLLSRLTDHYLQIIANRAPIGFEAEFVATRGHNTLYRGILMPFSSDEDTIDFIYGVINWKELVDAETQAKLDAEVDASVRTAPKPVASRARLGRRARRRARRRRAARTRTTTTTAQIPTCAAGGTTAWPTS